MTTATDWYVPVTWLFLNMILLGMTLWYLLQERMRRGIALLFASLGMLNFYSHFIKTPYDETEATPAWAIALLGLFALGLMQGMLQAWRHDLWEDLGLLSCLLLMVGLSFGVMNFYSVNGTLALLAGVGVIRGLWLSRPPAP